MLIIFQHFDISLFFISLVNSFEIHKVTKVCLQDRQMYGHVDIQTDRMRPVYPQT